MPDHDNETKTNTNSDEQEEESSVDDIMEKDSSIEVEERMWAAVSFVFILIIIGVPLWWKMTEVERSYFPYEDIADLRNRNLSFSLNIDVHFWQAHGENLTEDLNSEFQQSSLYKVVIRLMASQRLAEKSLAELENMAEIHKQQFGDIQLIEVSSLKSGEIVMGKHRTAYFSSKTEAKKIYQFLQEVLLHEKMLLESVVAVVSPGLMSENVYYLRKVRPSPKYDVIFTVVNPQPGKIHFDWNNQVTIERYFRPVLQSLSSLSEFRIKSQWLYLIDLQQTPRKVEDYFTLNEKQIPHIITPLEKKIGSGVAQNPCVNFVLYISRCEHSPTVFIDEHGRHTSAILSARWGGVQLINLNRTHCEEGNPLVVDPEIIMQTFLLQFRTLLGLKDSSSTGYVLPAEDIIQPWEVDGLYRMRILELFISSRITLTSLSQLLGEISNIVITDEVGDAVIRAVTATQDTLKSLADGNLIEALNVSTEAFVASEFAFTHPSLLALLYFPDDQKYAVYIPLYLPVMIPVLLSLKNIHIWLKRKIFDYGKE